VLTFGLRCDIISKLSRETRKQNWTERLIIQRFWLNSLKKSTWQFR